MTISENRASAITVGDNSKKYFCTYESGAQVTDLVQAILADPELPQLKAIIIGAWDEQQWETDPSAILEMFVEHKEKFQHIESLYIGEMDYEECEISWIQQGNYEALFKALPNLQALTIQGADGLELGFVDHPNLEKLEIICGGLPVRVVNSLKKANLPNLKQLILYLGIDNYGNDCTMSDFRDLAQRALFPELKYLGFLDSSQQDELTEIILNSDLMPQLETIDISCGCLTDQGGQLILDAAHKLTNLKQLKASYHFLSQPMMQKLQALPFEVDVSDPQLGPIEDPEYMWPMITE